MVNTLSQELLKHGGAPAWKLDVPMPTVETKAEYQKFSHAAKRLVKANVQQAVIWMLAVPCHIISSSVSV